jgi:acetyl-CoA acetyltransferase
MTGGAYVRDAFVAGIGVTPFHKYEEGATFWDYGSAAVLSALSDADMTVRDIQAVFCGGVYTDIADGHRIMGEIGMTGIPIVNVENACSSGSSALRLAYQQVATGLYDVVLACGTDVVPKEGLLPSQAWPEWERELGFNVQPANYALRTVRYMSDSGATIEDISSVTVKNRRNGSLNPNAMFRKPVTLEEVLHSRTIATPLRLLHCAALAQGGAAAIVSSSERAGTRTRKVSIAAAILTSGTYGAYTYYGDSVRIANPTHVEIAAAQAWAAAGLGPEDIDVAQVYDTISAAELWNLEYLGFCPKGEAPARLREGSFDLGGKLPVNTDGGLMARGHPMGATGLAQIVEIVQQLRGDAGPRQVAGAHVGLAHSMGSGPNCSITILKS